MAERPRDARSSTVILWLEVYDYIVMCLLQLISNVITTRHVESLAGGNVSNRRFQGVDHFEAKF